MTESVQLKLFRSRQHSGTSAIILFFTYLTRQRARVVLSIYCGGLYESWKTSFCCFLMLLLSVAACLHDTAITGWAAETLTVSCDGDNLEFGEDNRKRPTLVARRVHSGASLWWSGVSGGCRLFWHVLLFALSLSLSLYTLATLIFFSQPFCMRRALLCSCGQYI